MKTYLLDTSAILTLRDDENGAQTVADLLYQSSNREARCLGCFMTQMEVFYRIWKDEGEVAGRLAYEMLHSLPVEWVHESTDLIEQAARIKATHSLSLADAWIAASAWLNDAVLVHKDPEFSALEVKQLSLPFKQPG
jgi:predicted nucleic acid-binding protein